MINGSTGVITKNWCERALERCFAERVRIPDLPFLPDLPPKAGNAHVITLLL